MINYQTEIQKLDDLAKTLNILMDKVESKNNNLLEGRPPMWSGDISVLENYSNELQEWLDEPKLKQVKDIIKEFQMICDDKRRFQFDSDKNYYISILAILIRGKAVLEYLTYSNFKNEGIIALLDHVFQQNDTDDLEIKVNEIEAFWEEFTDEIIDFDTGNDVFIDKVKSDVTQNLIESIKSCFNNDEISDEYQKIVKAKNSRELLKEIDSNAFLSEYNEKKDIDSIWDISDHIRKLLDDTDINIIGISEDTHRKIFSELLNYVKSRDDALKKSDLTKIKEKLNVALENFEMWHNKINRFIEDDVKQLDSWLFAIENTENNPETNKDITVKISELKQKFNTLTFDNINDLESEELYDAFEEYYEVMKYIDSLFKTLLSDDAKKILDNLSKLDGIKNDLGDNFWSAAKELCERFPQLKIKMEWHGV